MASISVVYTDGTTERYKLGPKALLAAEDELGTDARNKPMRATFTAAWKASKSTSSFDDWLDTVEEFSESEGDAPADPTSPEPSPVESPT